MPSTPLEIACAAIALMVLAVGIVQIPYLVGYWQGYHRAHRYVEDWMEIADAWKREAEKWRERARG